MELRYEVKNSLHGICIIAELYKMLIEYNDIVIGIERQLASFS